MLRKLVVIFILSILSVFVPPSLRSVSAQRINNQGGISIPASGPIYPVPNVISGQVSYRVFGMMLPASFVRVDITSLQYSGSWFTYTDFSGRYYTYPSDGVYKIKVSDFSHTIFIPPERLVRIKGQEYFNIDFRGIKNIFNQPEPKG